ncbi:MAG: hypothetical protein ACAH59_04125 [Pseudobdellovibrionaceae bacterium]
MMTQKPLLLIPAAGFGRRVGQPPAKELLPDPSGRPLIERALKQAQARGWPVHVITRDEKMGLIQFLRDFSGVEIQVQVIEPSREWPETVLKSRKYWRERNILCLPDTVFSPEGVLDSLASSKFPLAVAAFETSEYSTWGVMKTKNSGIEICEKPIEARSGMRAWGLISFEPFAGEKLFEAQLESTFDHQWKELPIGAEFFSLETFSDLTR